MAVAVTALAVSGVNAGLCKPDVASTTTTEACAATCTVLADPPSDATCGSKNTISSELLLNESESLSLEDCAQICVETENCDLFSNAPASFPGSNFYCKLYSEYTLTPSDSGVQYYQRNCFDCNGGGRCGRGGRGGRRR
ncbi:hypothetical protein QQZ08_005278 [Neonectria magnoliae]|uniref:Apple domain-containing protein n=1 Tax=Neonectria magnoliae TaxID=2732573 RepID=A0ABR1I5I4_9HYPO